MYFPTGHRPLLNIIKENTKFPDFMNDIKANLVIATALYLDSPYQIQLNKIKNDTVSPFWTLAEIWLPLLARQQRPGGR